MRSSAPSSPAVATPWRRWPFADEVARNPPVGRGRDAFLVGGAALDPGHLAGYAELTPADTVFAVEDKRRVGCSRPHPFELPLAVQLRRGLLADPLGVEAHAPAAAEHAVVALHQRGERVPRRLIEGLDRVCRFRQRLLHAQGRRAQFGGRSRRNRSTVAYACLQSEVSSATLAPWRAASSDTG